MKLDGRVFAPPNYRSDRGKSGVSAVKALYRGEADKPVQQFAIEWIIEDLCRTRDISYRPDDAGGDRDTAFAEGRRFVGLQLARILTLSFERLTQPEKYDKERT